MVWLICLLNVVIEVVLMIILCLLFLFGWFWDMVLVVRCSMLKLFIRLMLMIWWKFFRVWMLLCLRIFLVGVMFV